MTLNERRIGKHKITATFEVEIDAGTIEEVLYGLRRQLDSAELSLNREKVTFDLHYEPTTQLRVERPENLLTYVERVRSIAKRTQTALAALGIRVTTPIQEEWQQLEELTAKDITPEEIQKVLTLMDGLQEHLDTVYTDAESTMEQAESRLYALRELLKLRARL